MKFKAIRFTARNAGFGTFLLAGVAAATASLGAGALATPVAAAHADGFTPPDQPMILSRMLRRPLPGGAEVLTQRTYQIRFIRSSDGYRIEGKLLKADIEVPARFEVLAQIERNRPDTGLFPMDLDHQGRLLPGKPRRTDDSTLAAAHLARSLIPARLSPHETHNAQAFIGTISATPVQTAWPEDLFSPEPGKRSTVETLPMPDGKTGQVSMEIEASVDSRTGLLSQLTRRVTTDLDGSERVTIETWSLAPLDEK